MIPAAQRGNAAPRGSSLPESCSSTSLLPHDDQVMRARRTLLNGSPRHGNTENTLGRYSSCVAACSGNSPLGLCRPKHGPASYLKTVCRSRSRRSWHTGQREPTRDGGPRAGAFWPIHPVSTQRFGRRRSPVPSRTSRYPRAASPRSSRIMALRRHHNHQPQTHAPPGSTHAPARRPSPPMPGGSPPAGPTISSILGDFRTGAVRPGFRERSPALLDHLIRPLQKDCGMARPRALAVLRF